LGDRGTVLLAGPGPEAPAEPLHVHRTRLGAVPPWDADQVRALLAVSRLDGRGGGGFPLGRKVDAAIATGGAPVVFVNASESEPASTKDATLCARRPHLVLDGAALVAVALGVPSVTVHLHRGATDPIDGITGAIAERTASGHDRVRWAVVLGPDRYVAGEASAVAGFAHDGDARPRFTAVPLAVEGPSGRPTVVVNAETAAHLGLLARIGPTAWSALGWGASPGPRLLTLAGAVTRPGRTVEMVGAGTIGDVLAVGGWPGPPGAVLVGGFAGTWLTGEVAWRVPWERTALADLGAGPGCGLLGVVPRGACALAETARIVTYLAGESAGQCGTCVAGLPRLAASLSALADGSLGRRGLRRVGSLGDELLGRGACGHPDGVVRLVRSALRVFRADVARHLAGEPCLGTRYPPVLPVPAPRPGPAGGRPGRAFR